VKLLIVDRHTTTRRVLQVGVACCLIAAPMMSGADEVSIPVPATSVPLGGARVTGKVTVNTGASVQIELRDGRSVTVDLNAARKNHLIAPVFVGEFLVVQGSLSGALMTAVSASRAKSNPAAWMPDIP
jgi:hypothetical protein